MVVCRQEETICQNINTPDILDMRSVVKVMLDSQHYSQSWRIVELWRCITSVMKFILYERTTMHGITRLLFFGEYASLGNGPAMYVITNPLTRAFYIGSTKCIRRRLFNHTHLLKNNTHSNKLLQKEFNELWNPKEMLMVSIEFHATVEEATIAEQKYLNEHYSETNCLNVMGIAHGPKRSGSSIVSKTLIESDKYRQYFNKRYSDPNTAPLLKYIRTQEAYQKKSEVAIFSWRRPEYRKAMIDLLGHTVIVGGVRYSSVREASRMTGVSILTIRSRMIDGNEISIQDIRKPFRKVSVKGIVYDSVNEAAYALGVKANTMTWRCQNASPNWSDHFYIED